MELVYSFKFLYIFTCISRQSKHILLCLICDRWVAKIKQNFEFIFKHKFFEHIFFELNHRYAQTVPTHQPRSDV